MNIKHRIHRRGFLKHASLIAVLPVSALLVACDSASDVGPTGGSTVIAPLPATAQPADSAVAETPVVATAVAATSAVAQATAYLMPAEEHAHVATYMAFASDADGIWEQPSKDNAGLDRVRADLMDVAKAIGTFEPVMMLVLPPDVADAQAMLTSASTANPAIHQGYTRRGSGTGGIALLPVEAGFNDYWTRDTACIFANDTANKNMLVAIDFNFNGWGNANSLSSERDVPATSNQSKAEMFFQVYANDQKVAAFVAGRQGAKLIKSSLTLEGGAIECDGEGTAIITESAVLHVNRNPQLFDIKYDGKKVLSATLLPEAKATVLAELKRTLGVIKIIWLTGTRNFPNGGASTPEKETDITNGHTDFYAKFLKPGVVAFASDPTDETGEKSITAAHQTALAVASDAKGRQLKLVELRVPTIYGGGLTNRQRANFAAGYINFYTCNKALVMPKFGDPVADAAARDALAVQFPDRTIVQVDILGIAAGGGGLHCATAQVPA